MSSACDVGCGKGIVPGALPVTAMNASDAIGKIELYINVRGVVFIPVVRCGLS